MTQRAWHETKTKKCAQFKVEVSFLGRIISANGYQMDPKATDACAVTKSKGARPETVREARKIMGLLDVYPRSIENFSKLAKPLYDLLNGGKTAGGESPKRKRDLVRPATISDCSPHRSNGHNNMPTL